MGLIRAELLGAEKMRPRQMSVGSHIGEELDVAIRKRADGESLGFQSREAGGRVGPAVKMVPYSRYVDHLVICPETGDGVVLEQCA